MMISDFRSVMIDKIIAGFPMAAGNRKIAVGYTVNPVIGAQFLWALSKETLLRGGFVI
ncbi:hypothetical protein [Desulforamulus ruminis]|uniref:hypothetical protein n=1 Tax=Desulforamulus ruminis TaxID=1564 RepID=UPI001650EDFB|nr:hypothetical protein [Desulforamulus ruminis]